MDRSDKPRKRRVVLHLGLLALALLLGWWLAAAPVQRAWARLLPGAQDRCRIGSVTPERYAEIAAGVAKLPPIPWDEVVAAATFGENPVLTAHLRDAIGPIADLDTRLATIHAILRRTGAEYTSTLASPNAPLPQSSHGLRQLSFDYNIDIWQIGFWRPICRSAKVVVALSSGVEASIGSLDFDYAALVVPSCFKRFSFYEPPASSCVPTPDEALAELKARQQPDQ